MNPDTAIRPWLRACGETFGVNEVHNYHWPDASTRPQEPFFVYKIIETASAQDGHTKFKSVPDQSNAPYTSRTTGEKQHETTVRIDLYRSINGVQELAKCCIAAEVSDTIKEFFKESGCAFKKISEQVEDMTPEYDALTAGDITDQIHHRVDVVFYDNIQFSLDETNNVVEEINLSVGLT